MRPEDVNRKNFTLISIIYTSPDGGFSIAKGTWNEDEMTRFAIRWNGDINNQNHKGFPTYKEFPVWFQLPYDLRDFLTVLIKNSDQIGV